MEEEILHITCFALRLPHGLWEIQCGPLPFADIRAMHQNRTPDAVVVELGSGRVRRDISDEEDEALRSGFISQAKADGWTWDAPTQRWRAPEHIENTSR